MKFFKKNETDKDLSVDIEQYNDKIIDRLTVDYEKALAKQENLNISVPTELLNIKYEDYVLKVYDDLYTEEYIKKIDYDKYLNKILVLNQKLHMLEKKEDVHLLIIDFKALEAAFEKEWDKLKNIGYPFKSTYLRVNNETYDAAVSLPTVQFFYHFKKELMEKHASLRKDVCIRISELRTNYNEEKLLEDKEYQKLQSDFKTLNQEYSRIKNLSFNFFDQKESLKHLQSYSNVYHEINVSILSQAIRRSLKF